MSNNLNKATFWPSENNVPWGKERKELPFTKENFKEFILKTYFLKKDGSQRKGVKYTPKGNRFDYQILVEEKIFKENEESFDVLRPNYWMSDLNVGQKEGNSFFFVKDYNIRYRQNGEIYYELTLTLDEWSTFYEEINEVFYGPVLKTGGHEHEWVYDEKNDSFWPNFKENLGLINCTELCQHKNVLYYNDNEKENLIKGQDVLVLFLSAPETKNKILKTSAFVNKGIDPLSRMKTDNPTTLIKTQNNSTDSGFVIRILIDSQENRKYLNSLITTLENPIVSGLDNMFASITVKNNFTNSALTGSAKVEYQKNFWEQMNSLLLNESELADDFLGGGYKIQAVKKMTFTKDLINSLNKVKYLIPVGENVGQVNFTDNQSYKNIFSNWKLIEVFKGINVFVNDGRVFSLTEEVTPPYTKAQLIEKTHKTEVINLNEIVTVKELLPFHKEDILNQKLTPHLFTLNHFQIMLNNFFNQEKIFDLTDIIWGEGQPSINLESMLILSNTFSGYQHKIKTPAGKISPKNKNLESNMFFNSTRNENYPFNRDVFNEWSQTNANSIQTSAINAKKTFALEKREAKRQFIGSMISGVMRTGISVASAALTGGASIGLATAQSAVAATSAIGQAGIDVARAGTAANVGNAVGAGAGGIIGSIIARKNAIDEARVKEQNTFRMLGASILDTQNNPDNVGEGIDSNLFSQELNASNEKVNYESISFRIKELNEIDKHLIWFDRNQYGSSYTRYINLNGLENQFSHFLWNYLRLQGLESLLNPSSIPQPIKELIAFTFESGVIIHDLEKLNNKSFFDYELDNYDKILLSQKGNYEMKEKIFKENEQFDSYEIEKIIDLSPVASYFDKTDLISSNTAFAKIIVARTGESKEPLGVSSGGEVIIPLKAFDYAGGSYDGTGGTNSPMSNINVDYSYQNTHPQLFNSIRRDFNWYIDGTTNTSKIRVEGVVGTRDSSGTLLRDPDFYLQMVFYKKSNYNGAGLNVIIAQNNQDIKTLNIKQDTRINLISKSKQGDYSYDGFHITYLGNNSTNTDLITQRNQETYDFEFETYIIGSVNVKKQLIVNRGNSVNAEFTLNTQYWGKTTKEEQNEEKEGK